MAGKRLSVLVFPVLVLACSIAAGHYGPLVQAAPAVLPLDNPRDSAAVNTFASFYAQVSRNSAEPLDADKAIFHGAIPGMLQSLDPHSNFLDPRDYQVFMEEQRGRYFGIGMQVAARNGKTVVLAPFPGSPAYKAGIRPGDTIAFVNGKSTGGLTTSEVADLLKGPRGTPVQIVVSRAGAADYVSFTVIRQEINRKTVDSAFWVKPGVAYIRIVSFGDNTSRELDDALRGLGENRIQGLILDLRGNPGGLLNEAVAVCDRFLQRGQVVVSHRGRSSQERVYTANRGIRGREYPIVVLVNRYSASAAEIVSGALQDHDRAWILGETTFGKGLVQSILPLPEHTAVALTTAHFYTPSGRLIQRDYKNQSFYDYYRHGDALNRNVNDVKMTDSGRVVYGGGGITPDESYPTPRLDSLEAVLFRNRLFDFTRAWFATHSMALPQGWMPGDDTLAALETFLAASGVAFTPDEFARDRGWIRRYLAREMCLYASNVEESDRVFAMTDPEVEQALQAMPRAAALLDRARKAVTRRMGQQGR